MAALARWCVRRRLVAVLLWLLAFGGVAAAATVTGSAYSNDYGIPGTGSDRASQLLESRSPDLGGDSDTIVWHTTNGTVRAADVEQTMTAHPATASRTCRGWPRSPTRTTTPGLAPDQRERRHRVPPPSPSRPPPRTSTRARRGAVVDTAEAAEGDGLRIELGGSAIALTESGGGHLAEAVGVAVAAVVLFLAFGTVAAALLTHRHPRWSTGPSTSAACTAWSGTPPRRTPRVSTPRGDSA
ncbi:MMPL family transporter OS=Streptomyces tendae OX=1932 GN=GUR47_36540 PE=4 SV=1 [Streptomyces tendae]